MSRTASSSSGSSASSWTPASSSKKPYYAPACISHGPVAIDASETDISCGGNAETTEYTLIKFKCGELTLLAATLRPETVFGLTNFWINPEVEYVKVVNGDDIWVMSRPCLEKMKYQKDKLKEVGTIPGTELVGRTCVAPFTGNVILCLPATFCDPNVGTGLVMSVPSDAPDDWVALRMVQEDEEQCRRFGLDIDAVKAIKPIAIIETKGWGPMPAVEIVERMGITRSGDPKLVEAKKIVYKEGFHAGKMNGNCGKYSNLPVDKAKDMMKEDMIRANEADLFFDLSEKVICRCGEPVVIKKVDDQVVHRLCQSRSDGEEQGARQAHEHHAERVLRQRAWSAGLVPGAGPASARATGWAQGSPSTRSGSSRPSPTPPSIRYSTSSRRTSTTAASRPSR